MTEDPAPRTAVVTGANRGIGAAIAQRLLTEGYRVAGISRSGQAPHGVYGVEGDMRDTASIEAAFTAIEAHQGPTDVLVANAGINKDTLVMRMSEEEFTDVVDVNLTGVFRCVRRVTKGMIRRRGGRIVLISSVVGLYGSPGQVNYAASKAGLVGMARSVTRELGGRGITANVVAPGFIETAMTGELPEATQQQYLASIPAGRFGQADDVAEAVTYLASEQAGYISGAVLPVDGGLGMGH
ncbi:MAG TPA: 3-oxoacyl-ACP reductase FabG [Candidatus Ruania gallistercoris]|uniref:3-oxoacyl-ACP reductase FabG n=1 Tax=Candidatus Ruania gallistercoris TaxID=2838746 RepID=A0A9D2EC68_9MICO|nr:3-oxoacyl-ACP reductase FabG [Candidatus Ruania gallistercoris]